MVTAAKRKQAVEPLPGNLKSLISMIVGDSKAGSTIDEMMKREAEFSSPTAAMLAGIAADPTEKQYVEEAMDDTWSEPYSSYTYPEVIVGGGLHAAIYSAIRRRMGKKPPLVLEARDRVGGAFSVTGNPSFFLNSRNRPGGQGVPGMTGAALNFIPGAPVQPSDLGGSEYQTNDALGFIVRITLAMNAEVAAGTRVNGIDVKDGMLLVGTENGDAVRAGRVIFATGLGKPRKVCDGDRFLSFDQLMAKMDEPFPLKGMKRVAVVGGGDSGKTSIEALTGQGPGRGLSVASLDWIETIDWYGCPQENREEWVNCNRSRYKGIGSLLPSINNRLIPSRVQPLPREPEDYFTQSYQLAYVGEVPYDYVISCTGYEPNVADLEWVSETHSRRRTGRKSRVGDIHLIGPAARLEVDEREKPILKGISENETSIFRYAPRTALLAMSLD